MLSMFAIKIPASQMTLVNSRARTGSPFFVVTENKFRKGITPSVAIACSNLGAPVESNKEKQGKTRYE